MEFIERSLRKYCFADYLITKPMKLLTSTDAIISRYYGNSPRRSEGSNAISRNDEKPSVGDLILSHSLRPAIRRLH